MLTFATVSSTESTVEVFNNTLQSPYPGAICFKSSLGSARFIPKVVQAIPIWTRGSIRSHDLGLFSIDLSQFRTSKSSSAQLFFPTTKNSTLSYTLIESSARPLLESEFNTSTFNRFDAPALTPTALTIDGSAKWLVIDLGSLFGYVLLSGDVTLENFITYNTQPFDQTLFVGSNPSFSNPIYPSEAVYSTPIALPMSASSIRVAVSCSLAQYELLGTVNFKFAVSNSSSTSPLQLDFSTTLSLKPADTFKTQIISLPADSKRLHFWVSKHPGLCQINLFESAVPIPGIDTSTSFDFQTTTPAKPTYGISLRSSNPVCLSGSWSSTEPIVFGSASEHVKAVQLAVGGKSSQFMVYDDLRSYKTDLLSPVCIYSLNATANSSIAVFASPQRRSLQLNNNSPYPYQPVRIWDLGSFNRSEKLSVQNQGNSRGISVTTLPSGNTTVISSASLYGPIASIAVNQSDQFAVVDTDGNSPKVFLNTRNFQPFFYDTVPVDVKPGVYCYLNGVQQSFAPILRPGQIVIDFQLTSIAPIESSVSMIAAFGEIGNLPLSPSLITPNWSSDNFNLSVRANVIGSTSLCIELIGTFASAKLQINNMKRDFVTAASAASTAIKIICTEPRSYHPINQTYTGANISCSSDTSMKLRFAQVSIAHISTMSVQSCQSSDPYDALVKYMRSVPIGEFQVLDYTCQGQCAITTSGQLVMPSRIDITGIVSFIATDTDLNSALVRMNRESIATQFGVTDSVRSVDLCADQFCGGLLRRSPACQPPTSDDDLSASLTAPSTLGVFVMFFVLLSL